MVTASLAGLKVLDALGINAEVAIGHSLGEITALHRAGVLSEEALVRIVVPVTPGRETEADGLATGAASRVIPQLFAILPQFP